MFEGAPFEDLKDLISSSKCNSDGNSRGNCADETVILSEGNHEANKYDEDIARFRSALSDLQTEMSSLRNENEVLKTSVKQELDSIKKEVKSLGTDISEAVNNLQSTAKFCRQSIQKLGDEHSNGVASVKSDVKQIRDEIASIYEYTDSKDTEIFEKICNISSLEKRVTKLDNKLEQVKMKIPQSAAPHSSSNGLGYLKDKCVSTGTNETDIDISVGNTDAQTAKLVRCPRSGIFSRDKTNNPSTVPNHTSIVAQSSRHGESSTNNPGQNVSQESDPTTGYTAECIQYECPVANPYGALQTNDDVTAPGSQTYSGAVITGDSTQEHSEIPVLISDRQRKTFKPRVPMARSSYNRPVNNMGDSSEIADPDGDFIQHVRRKPSRYYIGGFDSSITEQLVISYARRRGVTVSRVSIRR